MTLFFIDDVSIIVMGLSLWLFIGHRDVFRGDSDNLLLMVLKHLLVIMAVILFMLIGVTGS